jgi:hypothetical protein
MVLADNFPQANTPAVFAGVNCLSVAKLFQYRIGIGSSSR